MKLIDIVKDMPWPEGAVCATQDRNGLVKWMPSMPARSAHGSSECAPDRDGDWWFLDKDLEPSCTRFSAVSFEYLDAASDCDSAIITREMWEAAQNPVESRAAGQQWRGPEDGLPPVGMECEALRSGKYRACKVLCHVKQFGEVFAVVQGDDWWFIGDSGSFRQLRTPQQRLLDDLEATIQRCHDNNETSRTEAEEIMKAFNVGVKG